MDFRGFHRISLELWGFLSRNFTSALALKTDKPYMFCLKFTMQLLYEEVY